MRQFSRILSIATLALTLSACATKPAGITVGAPAPAFALPATNGNTVALADYQNRQPVLLFFHMADG